MNKTIEILEKLVEFETVSADSNMELIHYVENFLTQIGFNTTVFTDSTGLKAGLYAEIGPAGAGVVLSGHTDVVPVLGQPWTRAPFQLSREGDKLFGRGTTDMKGFIACALIAAEKASKLRLKEPLKLVFSYDEEIGCVGMQSMIGELKALIGKPRFCLIGEPTEMRIAVGQKGKVALRASCIGQSGHSALAPNFVNALHVASDFIVELRGVQSWLQDNGARDNAYDIPFSTVHIGLLSGGTALNIVPDKAELTFEIRYLPEDTAEKILGLIAEAAVRVVESYRSQWRGVNIEIDDYNAYPGLDVSADEPSIKMLLGFAENSQSMKVAFGSEAGYFAGQEIPTVVCGPGSMAGQGHKPDEYVTIQQITACESMLDEVLKVIVE